MNWQIAAAGRARKQLKRFPVSDTTRIEDAIDAMAHNPFVGDIEKMGGEENVWRRRVGAYRILFEVFTNQKLIRVTDIRRRTSATY